MRTFLSATPPIEINGQVDYLTKCISNVSTNFVPNKITCKDKDPPWMTENVIPVHKQESKHLLKNYRPISLLPVCGMIFEKCIYNSLYGYLQSNDILSKSQSGFRNGDS